ncbi:retrovirus-related pol polyprotein from transposon TNT 1-94 [Tanacetum coccineum]
MKTLSNFMMMIWKRWTMQIGNMHYMKHEEARKFYQRTGRKITIEGNGVGNFSENQIVTYKKNEVRFSEEVAVLKREVGYKEYDLSVVKADLEKVKQEKDGIDFKIKGLDLSYTWNFDEFKEPEINRIAPRDSVLKPNTVCDKESDNSEENTDDSFGKRSYVNTARVKWDSMLDKPSHRQSTRFDDKVLLKWMLRHSDRFTWVFFLNTKDETSNILMNFIKEIENQVDKKVKVIRSDNGTEFKNKVLDEFCREKRAYCPRPIITDSRTFLEGFKPAINFMKPFGCHVTILNTLDHLGKFDGKSDEDSKSLKEVNIRRHDKFNPASSPKLILAVPTLNTTKSKFNPELRASDSLVLCIQETILIRTQYVVYMKQCQKKLLHSLNFKSLDSEVTTKRKQRPIDMKWHILQNKTYERGLQVKQKKDGIFISQDKYVAEILRKFNYTDVKSASTTIDLEKPFLQRMEMLRMLIFCVPLDKSTTGSWIILDRQIDFLDMQETNYSSNLNNELSSGLLLELVDRVLASQRQTAIGKGLKSNPFNVLNFALKPYKVAFLEKTAGSNGFHQIIDFLNRSHIHFALTKKPDVYISLIKQFWNSAESSTQGDGEGTLRIREIAWTRGKTITKHHLEGHFEAGKDTPTEVIKDKGSREKGEKEVTTVSEAPLTTASEIPITTVELPVTTASERRRYSEKSPSETKEGAEKNISYEAAMRLQEQEDNKRSVRGRNMPKRRNSKAMLKKNERKRNLDAKKPKQAEED